MQYLQTACWDRDMYWKSEISDKWMKGKQAKNRKEKFII